MKKRFLILIIAATCILVACNKQPQVAMYGTVEKQGDVLWNDGISEATVADGTHTEYINVRRVIRPDFRVVQDGGSGTISFQIFASWTPGATGATATYDDVGLDFYGSATFTGATTKLLDDGAKLRTSSWLKLVFTVSGASADASYTIEQALELSRD